MTWPRAIAAYLWDVKKRWDGNDGLSGLEWVGQKLVVEETGQREGTTTFTVARVTERKREKMGQRGIQQRRRGTGEAGGVEVL